MSYLIRRVLGKPRLILDEMCHLYGKFASYLRRVLSKTRLIFPRINGPTVKIVKIFACSNEQRAQREFWEIRVEVCSESCMRAYLHWTLKEFRVTRGSAPFFFVFTIWVKNEANGCKGNWVTLFAVKAELLVKAIFFSFLFFFSFIVLIAVFVFLGLSVPLLWVLSEKKVVFRFS